MHKRRLWTLATTASLTSTMYIIIKFTGQEHKVSLQVVIGLITMCRIYIYTRRARSNGLGAPLTSKAIFPHAYSRSGVGLVEIDCSILQPSIRCFDILLFAFHIIDKDRSIPTFVPIVIRSWYGLEIDT
ncbi:hypothetical protein F4814DRAFT_407882 [Daldinia grandis]|nr:hypothetical protein F4814DRAFT_407882 [Daldinia grandis]